MCELELESQAAGLGACFQWKQFPSAASGGVSGAGGSDQQASKTAQDEALLSSFYCPVVLVPQVSVLYAFVCLCVCVCVRVCVCVCVYMYVCGWVGVRV